MTQKISEQVSQRKDLGNDLSARIGASLDEVAFGYGAYLSPVVAEGEQPIDSRQQLVLLLRRVDGHVQDLDALDAGVVAKVHDTDKVRSDVGDLTNVVVSTMRSMRHTVRGGYGPDGVARTGLKGDISRRPLRVYERARLVQASLENPELGLKPVLKVVGNGDAEVEADAKILAPADLAAAFEPALTQLGQQLRVRYAEKVEDIDARYLRQKGIKEFDRHIRAIVRIVQGIFVLAGREDLAQRFTTSLPRFVRRTGEAGEETPQPIDPPSDSQDPSNEPITDSTPTP